LRVFLQIIAWLGALIIGLAVSMVYSAGGFDVDMYGMGLLIATMVCFLGVFLLLLGGLTSRGRFLWIITLLVAIAYLAVLPRVWMPHQKIEQNVGWLDWQDCVFSAFPGVICFIGGIIMRRLTFKNPWNSARKPKNTV